MSIFKCPGSDRIREPFPENIKCFSCGKVIEIWSDEVETECPGCGKRARRELPPNCLEWCAFARECVGPEKLARYKKRKSGKK